MLMQHRLYYVIIMETTCTCQPGFTGLPEPRGWDLTAPPAEPAPWVQGLSPSPRTPTPIRLPPHPASCWAAYFSSDLPSHTNPPPTHHPPQTLPDPLDALTRSPGSHPRGQEAISTVVTLPLADTGGAVAQEPFPRSVSKQILELQSPTLCSLFGPFSYYQCILIYIDIIYQGARAFLGTESELFQLQLAKT